MYIHIHIHTDKKAKAVVFYARVGNYKAMCNAYIHEVRHIAYMCVYSVCSVRFILSCNTNICFTTTDICHTHTHTHIHTYIHSLKHTYTHTHTLTYHSLTLTHIHTHSLSLSHIHTHTHTAY
jgi:hypothetical protein